MSDVNLKLITSRQSVVLNFHNFNDINNADSDTLNNNDVDELKFKKINFIRFNASVAAVSLKLSTCKTKSAEEF